MRKDGASAGRGERQPFLSPISCRWPPSQDPWCSEAQRMSSGAQKDKRQRKFEYQTRQAHLGRRLECCKVGAGRVRHPDGDKEQPGLGAEHESRRAACLPGRHGPVQDSGSTQHSRSPGGSGIMKTASGFRGRHGAYQKSAGPSILINQGSEVVQELCVKPRSLQTKQEGLEENQEDQGLGQP